MADRANIYRKRFPGERNFSILQERMNRGLIPGISLWQENILRYVILRFVKCRQILEHFKIGQEEIMAFGDGDNDIDMLRYAHIGVAMGNAGENVKTHADYVTACVDDDGIYKALKVYGLL